MLFLIAIFAAVLHIISAFSAPFADFMNRYPGAFVRGVFTTVSNIFPFSLTETLILFIPVLFVALLIYGTKAAGRSFLHGVRCIFSLLSALTLLYSVYVFSAAFSYNTTPLAEKLGFTDTAVSADGLKTAAQYMVGKMNDELDEVDFKYKGGSYMPYTVSEMNDLLMDAFDKVCEKYSFVSRLHSRIKPIALSEPLTYTHISGLYSYYTGEANLNVNFPDYTLPFTAAHELAHQRGIIREDEANFMAFLVCSEADDAYIRYSGYLGMYEYLNDALYNTDYGYFADVYTTLDSRVLAEMKEFNRFFEKYQDSMAASISSAVNDTYLKLQGVSEGEKSYGLAVELAVAYVAELEG